LLKLELRERESSNLKKEKEQLVDYRGKKSGTSKPKVRIEPRKLQRMEGVGHIPTFQFRNKT